MPPRYVPLKIQPGVFRNGTRYQAKGRWYLANLVRWTEGAMQAIGGWAKIQDSDDTNLDLTDPVRGLLGWRANSAAPYLAMGTYDKAYGFTGGVLTEITPAGFTAGEETATVTIGAYGAAAYDAGVYGMGAGGGGGTTTEANSWQFDAFGEELVACAFSDGKIYHWDLVPTNALVEVGGEPPDDCTGVVVTPERFLVALGGKGNVTSVTDDQTDDQRRVIWSDQENYDVWDPTVSGSQAGDFILSGVGAIRCGARNRNETLIWTEVDLFAMRYIGGVLIYSFVQVGANCGIISRRAHAEVDGRSYWMGHRNFFMYDGFAKPLPCDIGDEIFNDLNSVQTSKISAWSVSEFNEIWFTYPSSGSDEVNKVVSFNYLENHWSGPWDLVRTDGIDKNVWGTPVMTDSQGGVYYHESGTQMLDESDADGNHVPAVESGPFEIGGGDEVMTVNRYIPDETTYGDMAATLCAAFYPTDTSEDSQAIIVGEISDVRLTGRQIRLKFEQTVAGWRFGVPRLEIIKRGRR